MADNGKHVEIDQMKPVSKIVSTPYRVSTMTATSFLGCCIDLTKLYQNIPIVVLNDTDIDQYGIVYAEFGSNKHDQIFRGVNLKKKFVRKEGKRELSTKRFDNSITIKLYKSKTELLNIKVFKNGKVQMTGVKHTDSGVDAVEFLITIIKDVNVHTKLVEDIDCLICSDFKIHLINSDFKVNMEIRRDLLFQLLTKSYDVTCTYEPCIYPGVKIQYFLNKSFDFNSQPKEHGVCSCSSRCDGKGNGLTTDTCKKITISIFQSGCILITGVTAIKHIEIGYAFIVDLLKRHEAEVKRIKLEI